MVTSDICSSRELSSPSVSTDFEDIPQTVCKLVTGRV